MSAGQFGNLLPSLQTVDLTSNVCIDAKFSKKTEIRGMISGLNASCNYERLKGNSNEVPCEEISRSRFGLSCYIGTDTEISSQGYKLTSNADQDFTRIQRIDFHIQDKRLLNVRYLPVVNRFIQNLIEYNVNRAAITIIEKGNFEGMIWLERLTITETFIESIPRNTFQGLIRLSYINLGKR